MRVVAGLLGAALVLVAVISMIQTLVASRGTSPLVAVKDRALGWLLRGLASVRRSYVGRDAVLVWLAPLSLLSSLVMWLMLYFVGFGLMEWAVSGLSLFDSFREAGSSLWTLGYASSPDPILTALDFAAAASGPLTIAMLVGYLPTVYAAYQRRETDVTLLLARAGEPAWGPEVLRRHWMSGLLGDMDRLYADWEQWAAQIAESHTNFPVLIHMRSARPLRTWLVSLLAVMDAAALQLALTPSLPQMQARIMLRQGFTCLREIGMAQRIPIDSDPSPDTPSDITFAEFEDVCTWLSGLGYPIERTPAEAYPHFRGWRANYEKLAYALADEIYAVPAPWSGPRHPKTDVVRPIRVLDRKPSEG